MEVEVEGLWRHNQPEWRRRRRLEAAAAAAAWAVNHRDVA